MGASVAICCKQIAQVSTLRPSASAYQHFSTLKPSAFAFQPGPAHAKAEVLTSLRSRRAEML
jgi:hypothetical protein